MRCAALAEAWIGLEVGAAVFWGEASLSFARRRIEALGARLVDRYAPATHAAVLVCDHYEPAVRGAASAARDFGLRVIVDDLGTVVEPGFDVVRNPNAYASPRLYRGFTGAVLAGADVIAVRADLPTWCPAGASGTAVMLGGSRLHESLVEGLALLAERAGADRFAGSGSWVPSGWATIDPENPWEQIARADRLIISSGTTVWEAASVGIPVVLVQIASNQDLIFKWARDHGVPGVDARPFTGQPDTLSRALEHALSQPRRLPHVENGAANVSRLLRELAEARRS